MRSFLAMCLLGLPLACARADGDPQTRAAPPGFPRAKESPHPAIDPLPSVAEGPVVLELFTSQGCSSCPAADRLLSKLATAGALGDRAVAPLSFHVDYWNDLGWADPFSLSAWTERQHQYARALKDDRVYTPELVVGGASGVVGSNTAAVAQAIQHAVPPAVLTAAATWSSESVTVAATAPADADVWVAVWEDRTTTKVTRGENAGETLGSDRVVRRLARVAAAGQKASVILKLDPAWRSTGAVAFAQRADLHIVASAFLGR
jgi:hypothetical protein